MKLKPKSKSLYSIDTETLEGSVIELNDTYIYIKSAYAESFSTQIVKNDNSTYPDYIGDFAVNYLCHQHFINLNKKYGYTLSAL